MTWTPTTEQLPPDGEVVEVKDENRYPDDIYLLCYDIKTPGFEWLLACPKDFTPTHWRKKEKK